MARRSLWRAGVHWAILLGLIFSLLPALPPANPRQAFASAQMNQDVHYVYDPLGRLVGVIDPAVGTARYTYDAVGNITSVTRPLPDVVSIIDFSPHQGPVGTQVTIYGTGFGTVANTTVMIT